MEAIKLSVENLLLSWAEICIEWFMNLFADPEYYWVEENYPSKRKVNSFQKENTISMQVEPKTNKHLNLTGLKSLDKIVIKMIKKIVKNTNLTYQVVIELFHTIKFNKLHFTSNYLPTIIKME